MQISLPIHANGWQQLFASSPDSQQEPSCFVDYISSSDGVWDCFSVIDSFLSHLQLFCSPSSSSYELIGRASQGIATVGGALSVPACLVAGFQLYRQVEAAAYSCEGQPWRETAKKIALKIVDLINNLTYLPGVLSQLRGLPVTPGQQCFADSVYYISSLVLDVSSFPSFEDPKPWMNTAKSVLSVTISLLSIGGMICGVPLWGSGSFAITLLHVNSFWLAVKISTHL